MLWLIAAFIGGISFGKILGKKAPSEKRITQSQTVLLIVIFILMGIDIGANESFRAQIPLFGWNAFVLGTSAVIGSVAFVALFPFGKKRQFE